MNGYHSSRRPYTFSILFALMMFLTFSGTTQSQVVGKGYNNSLIYKIQSDTNTVYLLGSIHILAEEYYPLTRAFSYSYYNSQKVIFEIDPEILFSLTPNKNVENYHYLQNGNTLEKVLHPKTLKLLKKRVAQMGLDFEPINKLKPWAVNKIIGRSPLSTNDFRPDLGIEYYFFRLAKDAGKPTGGLETIEDQLDIDDKLPLKMQDKILRETLTVSNSEESEKKFLHLVKNWHQGNFSELEHIIQEQKAKNLTYHNSLLTNRNKRWIPQIENFLLEDKNVLVIIGAAHLVGDDGLVTLLTEKGHTLERVSYAIP